MSSLEAQTLRHFIESQDQVSRYILLLHYYDELTTKEIGLVLDLSESYVSKRLGHLKQQAQQQLLLCRSASKTKASTASLSAIA